MSPYILAVILAILIIAAVTGGCCFISMRNHEGKKEEQRQGPRRNMAVKGGVAVNHQENGYFLKNMQQINTIQLNITARRKGWNLILRNVKTNEVLFQGSCSGELLLGRGQGADRRKVVLNDPEISKEHCVILDREDSLYLVDLQSKNHTYLNGKLVAGIEVLRTEDILFLGSMQIQVFFG